MLSSFLLRASLRSMRASQVCPSISPIPPKHQVYPGPPQGPWSPAGVKMADSGDTHPYPSQGNSFASLWDIYSLRQSGILQRLRNMPENQQIQCRHFFPTSMSSLQGFGLFSLGLSSNRGHVAHAEHQNLPHRAGASPSPGHTRLLAPGRCCHSLG